ncbi:MucBP domain-containing protein [Pediococcus siamensis]|uniref:MucBP domain-containing protein n=1 Tax=Pediococcus siamensis TaxID=381829 RepID=UPI0039A3A4A1
MSKAKFYQMVSVIGLTVIVTLGGQTIAGQAETRSPVKEATSTLVTPQTASSQASSGSMPSKQTPETAKKTATVKVHVRYVNQNNQKIAPDKVTAGSLGAAYDVTAWQKRIPGYHIVRKQNIVGKYSAAMKPIVFHYLGNKVTLTIRDVDDQGTNLDRVHGKRRVVTGYYGNQYRISPLKRVEETYVGQQTMLVGKFPRQNKIMTLKYTRTRHDQVTGFDRETTTSDIILGNLAAVTQTYPNGDKVAVVVNQDGTYQVGSLSHKARLVSFKQAKLLRVGQTTVVKTAKQSHFRVTILPSRRVWIQKLASGRSYQTDETVTSSSGHITSTQTTVKAGMQATVSKESSSSLPTQITQSLINGDSLTTYPASRRTYQVTLQNKAHQTLKTKLLQNTVGNGAIFKVGHNQYLIYRIGARHAITTTWLTGKQYRDQTVTQQGAIKQTTGKVILSTAAKKALQAGNLTAFEKTQTPKKQAKVAAKPIVHKAKTAAKRTLPPTNETTASGLWSSSGWLLGLLVLIIKRLGG